MIIGIPKEIKESEHRVGMTPSGVQTLIQNGHDVYVQNSAGQGSGHSDQDYSNVGANLLNTIEEIYDISEMIIKVKEHHAKQLAKLKKNKNKKHHNNPFLKGEDINVEENLALDDVSSSCLICHK